MRAERRVRAAVPPVLAARGRRHRAQTAPLRAPPRRAPHPAARVTAPGAARVMTLMMIVIHST